MPLYLVRHTQVAVMPGTCYGQLDVPLASSFAEEACTVRRRLEHLCADALPPIWTSPSLRCALLAQSLSPDFQSDIRLKELNFGDWEGKSWDEIDSPEARYWGDHWQSAAPPNGESLPQLLQRLSDFINQLNCADAIVITHAGPIRALHHQLLNEPLEQAFARPIGFGEVFCLPSA